MPQAESLYRLQQIELEAARSQQRLDEIAKLLADDAEIAAAQQHVKQASEAMPPVRTKVRDLELEMQSTSEKAESTEKQLYSGSVTSPKAMQDMQQEIESLKRWRGQLEDRLLEAMVAQDEAQERLDDANQNLESVTASKQGEHSDLLAEQAELQGKLETLRQKREQAAGMVSPQSLKAYETLKPRRAGRPVSVLNGDSCSACGVSQTMMIVQAVQQGDKLIQCTNCGRILSMPV